VSYSDSDWAGNPETRISMTGFIIYLLGVPICWRLEGQKGVTLSSGKAEYAAISEAVKETHFVYFILKEMGVDVKLLNVVRYNNVGAIFMTETQVQELEYVILIQGIILFVSMLKTDRLIFLLMMLICLRKIWERKRNKEINEKIDKGNSKLKISDLNELAFTGWILSINLRTSSSKLEFNMIK
jgi:hypothetical protein